MSPRVQKYGPSNEHNGSDFKNIPNANTGLWNDPDTLLFILRSVFHTDQDDPSSSDDEGMPYTRPAKFKAAHSFKGPFDFDQIKVVQDLSGEHMVGLLYNVILCTDTLCATTCLY